MNLEINQIILNGLEPILGTFYRNHTPEFTETPFCVFYYINDDFGINGDDEQHDQKVKIGFDIIGENEAYQKADEIEAKLKELFLHCKRRNKRDFDEQTWTKIVLEFDIII